MCKISAVQGQADRTGSSCQLQLALPEWGYATGIAGPPEEETQRLPPCAGAHVLWQLSTPSQ